MSIKRIAACVAVSVLAGISAASAQPPPAITQYLIPGAENGPGQGPIVGPDGALWFSQNGIVDHPNTIGRLTTDGSYTSYALPGSFSVNSMVAGPDGALWFVGYLSEGLLRMTTDGVFTQFPLPVDASLGSISRLYIAVGSDGAFWIGQTFSNTIFRATTSGTVTAFSALHDLSGPIIAGPDGALWFIEFSNILGRMTTSGAATEFPFDVSTAGLGDITPGPDGAVWFSGVGHIGRITPGGAITEYALPEEADEHGPNGRPIETGGGVQLATGADGAIWFLTPTAIGRVTTGGVFTVYPSPAVPRPQFPVYPVGITAGPDGATWFLYSYVPPNGPIQEQHLAGRLGVYPGSQLRITSSPALPPGTVNAPYVQTLFTAGGAWPYQWSLSAGSLPGGLAVTNGAIAGTPTTAGTYTFTLQIADGNSTTVTQTFSITIGPAGCIYAIDPGGELFSAEGGTGSIAVSAGAGCPWSVTSVPSGVTLTGASSGSGNGTVTYTVAPNPLAKASVASLSIAGYSFAVDQERRREHEHPALPFVVPGFPPTRVFMGSMPDVAAAAGWSTIFTFVNKGGNTAVAQVSILAPNGTALSVPVAVPQAQSGQGPVVTSTFEQTLMPHASAIAQIYGPLSGTALAGAARLSATGTVDGFAIFHFDPTEQEAVVPLETRNAASYLLAFDNTNSVLTGVALQNVSGQAATIPVIIRDDMGSQVATGSIALNGQGQTSFVLSTMYPVTANLRGTVEFVTPPGGQISVLGIRYTGDTLTTIPVLANVGTNGGLMAHLAVNDGWQTTFVLVNAESSPAFATLSFFDDNGNALPLPLTFPQGVIAPQTAAILTQSIAPNSSLWVQSVSSPSAALQTGSTQLTSTGNISGYAVFRYIGNGQEMVVPLESRNAPSYVIAFDNTNETVTGIAVANASAQAINVSVILRDDTGTQIASGSIPLSANGHTSFVLASQFPQTAGVTGTAEFDSPAGATITVLGIRSPPALTFTTLPALAK